MASTVVDTCKTAINHEDCVLKEKEMHTLHSLLYWRDQDWVCFVFIFRRRQKRDTTLNEKRKKENDVGPKCFFRQKKKYHACHFLHQNTMYVTQSINDREITSLCWAFSVGSYVSEAARICCWASARLQHGAPNWRSIYPARRALNNKPVTRWPPLLLSIEGTDRRVRTPDRYL